MPSKSKSAEKASKDAANKESSTGSFRTASKQSKGSNDSADGSDMFVRWPRHIEKPVLKGRLLQKEYGKLEAAYYQECIALKKGFLAKAKEVWAKRNQLIHGDMELNSEECVMSDAEDGGPRHVQAREGVKYPEDTKGLPHFWHDVMVWNEPTSQIVQSHDSEILKCLKDITYSLIDDHDESAGFTLEFHFGENPYFNEEVLSKTYYQCPSPDANDPMIYEDPVPSHVQSTVISWKEGKSPMVKKVEKEYVNKKTGNRKKMTKEEPQQSFFQLFTSVAPKDRDPKKSEDEEFDKHMEILTMDFELGQFFKERLIPRAILYFTGEHADYEEDNYGGEGQGGMSGYSDMSGSGPSGSSSGSSFSEPPKDKKKGRKGKK